MIDWTKPQLCPQGTKHPSEFAPFPGGEPEEGSRIRMPDGVLVRIRPELIAAVGGSLVRLSEPIDVNGTPVRMPYPLEIPEGAEIELPQPAVGLRHKAIFEVLPDDYTEKKWGLDPEHSHPRVKCSVCGATFRKAALEESLAKK